MIDIELMEISNGFM